MAARINGTGQLAAMIKKWSKNVKLYTRAIF